MAPLCADPRQIVITLEPDQRRALHQLVDEITAYMIAQLDSTSDDLELVEPEDSDEFSETNKESLASEKPLDDPLSDTKSVAPTQSSNNGASNTDPGTEKKPPKAEKSAQRIQRAAIKHMRSWKDEFVEKLAEIVNVADTDKIQTERKKRREALDKHQDASPKDHGTAEDLESLRKLYFPLPTELKSLPTPDKMESLGCVLLLLLSTGKYSAHSRTLTLYLASSLGLSQEFVNHEEAEVAHSLMENSTADKSKKDAMNAEAETAKRQQDNKFSRYWKVGLASVAGAAVIGVTGGLAAPLVAGAVGGILGGVGLGGVASFLGVFWMNAALVGTLFGAYGAKMTGGLVDQYAKEVEDFRFIPLHEEQVEHDEQDFMSKLKRKTHSHKERENEERRLRVTIGINGWLNTEDDIKKPWRVLPNDTEIFALRFEMKTLLALGSSLTDLVKSVAWKTVKSEIIKRTVLATLFAALWPIGVIKMASNVDNPFSRARSRADKAGRILADALINKVQGERPVTLIGYSLGAVVIHSCLRSLAEREAFGLIDTVVIIGAPAPSSPAHWRTMRTVADKIFNVYSENDMILGFVYRMHSLALGVAGLQAISDVEGVENLDLSDKVSGHLRYPDLTGEILQKCGFTGVQAGEDIEMDDVIKMKQEHAQGKTVNFEDDDSSPPPPPPAYDEAMAEKEQGHDDTQQRTAEKSQRQAYEEAQLSPEEIAKLPPRPDEIDAVADPSEMGTSQRSSEEIPLGMRQKVFRKPVLPPRKM